MVIQSFVSELDIAEEKIVGSVEGCKVKKSKVEANLESLFNNAQK